jgi:glutamate racemase
MLVIACSTASTLVLPFLRSRFSIPVVGVVPGIKPAALLSKTKLITLLATSATVDRPDTQALIHTYAQGCTVTRVGSPVLATYSEAEFSENPATDAQLLDAITPCFLHQGLAKTDVIVLGCTHYPLVLHRLKALAPWPVTWINPAPAIAQRVLSLLSEHCPAKTEDAPLGERKAIFTAQPSFLFQNQTFLSRFQFTDMAVEHVPFSHKTQ